jgi:hypothetical protein
MGTPTASTVSDSVIARDQVCILTREGGSLDRAHICPHGTQQCFLRSNMQRYNNRQDSSGGLITDNLANALAVSCSRHRASDAGLFVFVPRSSSLLDLLGFSFPAPETSSKPTRPPSCPTSSPRELASPSRDLELETCVSCLSCMSISWTSLSAVCGSYQGSRRVACRRASGLVAHAFVH